MKQKPLKIALIIALIGILNGCKLSDLEPEQADGTIKISTPDWTEATHSKKGTPNYDVVFPQDAVNTIEIAMTSADWQAIKDNMTALGKGTFGVGGGQTGGGQVGGGGQPIGGGGALSGEETDYVPVSLKFNGKEWYKVGFRLKGNSTLSSTWRSGIYKLPFRLNFDRFEDKYPQIDDQRFYGFKELSMSAGVKDNSLIREKITPDIFRMAGIPAAKTAFYKVFIDFGEGKKYCGVYTMVEVPEDTMIKNQFGEEDGNIYKPESNFTSFNQTNFEKKNNEDAADWNDVKGAITALNASTRTSNPAAWRTELEKYMNMEHFVKWLAVNSTLVNWDTYGAMAHNHYLYNHPTNKLTWIPWDNNEALTSQVRVQLSLTGVANNWPLIKYVADDPVYYAKYKAYVKEFNDNVFTTAKMNAIFDKNHSLISPFVIGTDGEQKSYTNLTSSADFTNSLAALKQHIITRNKAVVDFLK